MPHCHDENHDHGGHGHGHGGHDHDGHDHSDDITPALQNLLYEQIDFSAINTLNESLPRSGASIVHKTWAQRLDDEPSLSSDVDEQLLMHIPFTAQIRLHSVLLRTSPSPSAPKTLHIFLNAENVDFDSASTAKPTQTLALSQTSEIQDIPVKRALFNTTRSLTLFFADNFSDGEEEVTTVSYLGFKGQFMNLNREPITVLYEAAANPRDHVLPAGVRNGLGSDTIGGAAGGGGSRDGM